MKTINRMFDEAIIVTDVGQHQMFVSQFAEITEKKRLLMSGGLGTMGYGLPGAIGAKIGNPDTPVISISGDGGMQMNIQEMATAVLEELPTINCIFNNYNLGMVRQWQKLFYGKRYSMTCLRSGACLERPGRGCREYGLCAGFCETGRKLRSKRNPRDEKRRDRAGVQGSYEQ